MAAEKPFEVDVSSRFGAPMGRKSDKPQSMTGKLHLQRVPFVDGDYDKGGAYWGGGDSAPLFCAWNDEHVTYLRASRREMAKRILLAENGELKFYR